MNTTQVDQKLHAAQRAHANDPERAELLARTRRFKSSWIELAEALTNVQKSQAYSRWGYSSFEDYTRRELHLKWGTVNKLVGTYAFLRKSAPSVLKRDGVHEEIPSLRALDLLRQASTAAAEERVPPEVLQELRQAVVEDNWPMSRIRTCFNPVLFPDKATAPTADRGARRAAASLLNALGSLSARLPEPLLVRLRGDIGQLLQALDEPDVGLTDPAEGEQHPSVVH